MKSMTGYGAAEGKVGKGRIFIEVRAVNHRYSDIVLKVPPKLHVLDPKFRKSIQAVTSRGKVELYLKEQQEVEPTPRAVLNVPLAKAYERCLRQFERTFSAPKQQLLDVIDMKELVHLEERPVKYERLWVEIHRVCKKALAQLDQMRRVEGQHLKRDQLQRLRELERLRKQVAKRVMQNQQKLRAEIRLALHKEQATENGHNGHESLRAAFDRMDVTEELTRLESHLVHYRKFTAQSGPIGRQLDFLIQEMNREVNTLASKASDAKASQCVVDIKSELEKLREQAQNIE